MFSSAINTFIQQHQYPELELKAVFFDMDGVLYDSMKNHAKAWIQVMKEFDIPFTEEDCYMHEGRTGGSTIYEFMWKAHHRKATEEEKEHIYSIKTDYFKSSGKVFPMPYAIDLLKKLKQKGLQLFIVTGSGQHDLFDNLTLDFPDIFKRDRMVTAYDVKNGKPHPEPYLKALEKSGVKPWNAIVVENAPLGVQSASSAGLFTIAVNTGTLNKNIFADYGANITLDSIEQLYTTWDGIFS